VGKSSLINALLGSKQAHTSSTPGRTRAINFFALHEGVGEKKKQRPALIFADLPGYGYAKISKSISAEWPKFIEPYLAERETLALGVCLVDTNIPPQPSDKQLIDFFKQTQRPFLVVGTKSDRLSKNALAKSLAALKREHEVEEVLAVSAPIGGGRQGAVGAAHGYRRVARSSAVRYTTRRCDRSRWKNRGAATHQRWRASSAGTICCSRMPKARSSSPFAKLNDSRCRPRRWVTELSWVEALMTPGIDEGSPSKSTSNVPSGANACRARSRVAASSMSVSDGGSVKSSGRTPRSISSLSAAVGPASRATLTGRRWRIWFFRMRSASSTVLTTKSHAPESSAARQASGRWSMARHAAPAMLPAVDTAAPRGPRPMARTSEPAQSVRNEANTVNARSASA
jgi:GTP-binding protein